MAEQQQTKSTIFVVIFFLSDSFVFTSHVYIIKGSKLTLRQVILHYIVVFVACHELTSPAFLCFCSNILIFFQHGKYLSILFSIEEYALTHNPNMR